jgi:hypothetical protein
MRGNKNTYNLINWWSQNVQWTVRLHKKNNSTRQRIPTFLANKIFYIVLLSFGGIFDARFYSLHLSDVSDG